MLTIDRWGPNGEEELSTLPTETYLTERYLLVLVYLSRRLF